MARKEDLKPIALTGELLGKRLMQMEKY